VVRRLEFDVGVKMRMEMKKYFGRRRRIGEVIKVEMVFM
jgi:hypothetical protein